MFKICKLIFYWIDKLMPLHRRFFVGYPKKRFRIPIYGRQLYRLVPQPRRLKRWYYRKSFEWWGHPSNHHWKGYNFLVATDLLSGERDIWTGEYCCGFSERGYNK